MNRYAIIYTPPLIINEGIKSLIKEISNKFETTGAFNYPPHIPLKYGFNFNDDNFLRNALREINQTIPKLKITFSSVKQKNGVMIYLAVEENEHLRAVQKKLHEALRRIGIIDFRDSEIALDYEYHLTLAEGNIDKDKEEKIVEYLKEKFTPLTFMISGLSIMVLKENKFELLGDKKKDIYERLINPEKPFIIGEIGSNHNGDINKAKQLIDIAVEAGCDAVKFQSFHYNSLFTQSILDEHKEMITQDVDALGLEAIQKKLALSKEAHIELKRYADEKGIIFFSYPLSKEHVDWLVDIKAPIIKVGSPDLSNLPLLRYIAKQQKPIILSVGMGTLSEIEEALETIYDEGNKQVVLLHCIAAYPPKYEDVNLRNIPMLKSAFNVPVGFSDHSTSTAVPAAAVALGASVIEKHIKLEGLHCRDEAVSLTPSQLKQLVKDICNVAKSMGTSRKVLCEDEKKRRVAVFGRRSILTARPMIAGEIIKEEDLVFKRPGTGISVNKYQYVIGRKINKNKNTEEQILWEDLQ